MTVHAAVVDVIMGVPVGFERAMTTQPYYRSSYVIVEPAAAAPVRSFDDPRLACMRLGVQLIGNDLAASPPGYALARRGYVANIHGYPVPGGEPAAQRIVGAIAAGELDGAFVWGPQAGFFASRAAVPLRVSVLDAPPGLGSQPFGLRVMEFAGLNVRWDSNAYGSVVWTLLSLHTAHLATDTFDSIILLALFFTGPLDGRRFVDVSENCFYWYFVPGPRAAARRVVAGAVGSAGLARG